MEANPSDGALVTLGGREYRPRLTYGAIRVAAEQHGVTISVQEVQKLPLHLLPRLGWMALLREHPGLTEDEAEALFEAEPEAAEEAMCAGMEGLRRLNAVFKRYGEEGKARAARTA